MQCFFFRDPKMALHVWDSTPPLALQHVCSSNKLCADGCFKTSVVLLHFCDLQESLARVHHPPSARGESPPAASPQQRSGTRTGRTRRCPQTRKPDPAGTGRRRPVLERPGARTRRWCRAPSGGRGPSGRPAVLALRPTEQTSRSRSEWATACMTFAHTGTVFLLSLRRTARPPRLRVPQFMWFQTAY
jgi:hypothetical protein